MPKRKDDEGDKQHKRSLRSKRAPLSGVRLVLIW